MKPDPRSQLFHDFRTGWEGGNLYDRKHLLSRVVEKVWVKGSEISALALSPSCHMVVTGEGKALQDGGFLAADGTLLIDSIGFSYAEEQFVHRVSDG